MTTTRALPGWRTHELPSGILAIQAPDDAHALFTLGLRQNPRRGFLFVSRVLGKHLPARPRDMKRSYDILAGRVEPGATVWIGMAETATALGRGVFEAYAARIGTPCLFVTTTRYRQPGEALTFEEPHSHATTQWLHVPLDEHKRARFLGARHVVIVDDEISTGVTAVNLVRCLAGRLPALERVTVVSLQDFAPQDAYAAAPVPVPVERQALLRGQVRFKPNPAWQPQLPQVTGHGGHHAPASGERLGVWPQEGLEEPLLAVQPGERVLVLGTGEFMSAAYALAHSLEQAGADAWVKATTRSPIVPYGELLERAEFEDNYGEGVTNYLYRSEGERYDAVFVLTEQPGVPRGLLSTLRRWYGGRITCV
ncbi:phosphoribosyltransferase domain-containing protein [Deinococcus peraridilitoris]|uniref:Pullulanase-like glycosidase possibly secreted by type II secretory pathway n=1 Tax=Deinococcus peraridilitoris (strain DSM 19664 / LMG 22246 / CIP 109416 / KR-200) TaxID=937777 RepID=L0A0T7_DEIPD|nr:phosphoribosyltransferase domain-containing protein [Deinococcus peraridilitoris]AFZ67461.1 pullulanase-like glycosidase possibly secreted by type II secretory pathway [Deinococcus peraridilitoris DSM 19664]